jgi:hypothetical protein
MDFEPNSNQNPNPNFNPNQNAYETYNTEPNQGSKSMATTSMVFGILALVTCICFCTSVPFGVVSIVLAVLVLVRKKNGKPFAITGIITSGLGILISLVTTLLLMPYVEDMQEFSENADAYVQEYQENGTIPEPILEICNNDEESAKQIMDSFVSGYSSTQESTTN